jgi:hypothetical protein
MDNVTIPPSAPSEKAKKNTLFCRILSSAALLGELAFLIWGIISFATMNDPNFSPVGGIVAISLIFVVFAIFSTLVLIKGSKLSQGTFFAWGIVGGAGWIFYCFFLVVLLVGFLLAGVIGYGLGAAITGANSSASSSTASSSSISLDPTFVNIVNGLDFLVILGIVVTLIIILRLIFMGLSIGKKKNPTTMALWFFISTILLLVGLLVVFGLNLYLCTLNGPTSIFGYSLALLGGVMCQIGADYFAFQDAEDKTKPYPEEVELGPANSDKTQD